MSESLLGYRVLSEGEKELINTIKLKEAEVEVLIHQLRTFTVNEDPNSLPDQRWVAIGHTDIQKGFMALCRSVAKPNPTPVIAPA